LEFELPPVAHSSSFYRVSNSGEGHMSSTQIIHTSDASFETDVLKADGPVLVDFWAEWCGPCKMIAPILEQAAGHYEGKIRIAKLNVDDNAASAAKFNIRSIPTLLLFHKGEVVASKVGAVSQSHLQAFLDGQLRAAVA
jgi:thioredoxin 1